MRHIIILVAAALIGSQAVRGEGFEIRLGFTNAHLRELFFGCSAKGTDGYDRDLDDFSPPPGIAVGYIGFYPPKKMPYFYRDIRGLEGPHQWKMAVKVVKDKPITISWDTKTLPEDWVFTLTQGETSILMHKKDKLIVETSATLTLRAELAPPETNPGELPPPPQTP